MSWSQYALQKRIPSKLRHTFYKNVQWADEYGYAYWVRENCLIEDAEVISSELLGTDLHAPVLDIDIPAALVPSSTEGHFHLYIDQPMTWRKYKRLLKAMAAAGLLEKGYVKASIRRKHTALRVPWVKKE